MAAHKHAEVIRAWADGAQVQMLDPVAYNPLWSDDATPTFSDKLKYRIKPTEQERVYPVTRMTGQELAHEWLAGGPEEGAGMAMQRLANAALRHAIDAGQVVPREEFDRMCGDRKLRDMVVAKAVYQWFVTNECYPDNGLQALIAEICP